MAKKSNKYYAFVTAEGEGVVDNWADCAARTQGRTSRLMGFATRDEAEDWLAAGAHYEKKAKKKREAQEDLPEDAVYFDAGTGRGNGTEVRVSDREGTTLIHLALDESFITAEGNWLLANRTNNFGELQGLNLAIQVAQRLGHKKVFGDSKLVIDFWSRGMIRKETAQDADLKRLVDETTRLRRQFEAEGGEVLRVSGSVNPADLGFHRD